MSDSDEDVDFSCFEDTEGDRKEPPPAALEILPLLPNIPTELYGEEDEEESEQVAEADEDFVFADFDGVNIVKTEDVEDDDMVFMDPVEDELADSCPVEDRSHPLSHSLDSRHTIFNYGSPDFFNRRVTKGSSLSGIQLDIPKSVAFFCAKRREPVFFGGHSGVGKTFLGMMIARTFVAVKQHVLFIAPTHRRTLSLLHQFQTLHKFNDSSIQTKLVERKVEGSYIKFVSLDQFLADIRFDVSFFKNIRMFIFDDFDSLIDSNFGGYWIDLMEKIMESGIRHSAGFLFLSRAYKNLSNYAEYFAKNTQRNCHMIVAHRRPFRVNDIFCSEHKFYDVIHDLPKLERERRGNQVFRRYLNDVETSDRPKTSEIRKIEELSFSLISLMEQGRGPVMIVADDDQEAELVFTRMATKFDVISLFKKERIKTAFKQFVQHQPGRTEEIALLTNIFPLVANGFGLLHASSPSAVAEIIQTCYRRGLITCVITTRQAVYRTVNRARAVIIPSIYVPDGNMVRLLTPSEVESITPLKGFNSETYRIILAETEEERKKFAEMKKENEPDLRLPETKTYASILDDFHKHGPQTCEQFAQRVSQQSFTKFDLPRAKSQVNQKITEIQGCLRRIEEVTFEYEIKKYLKMVEELADLEKKERRLVLDEVVDYLGIGRLIRVKTDHCDLGWAVVIGLLRRYKEEPEIPAAFFVSSANAKKNLPLEKLEPPKSKDEKVMVIRQIPREAIYDVSTYRLKLPISLMRESVIATLGEMLDKLIGWNFGTVPRLRLETPEAIEIKAKMEGLEEKVKEIEDKKAVMEQVEAYKARINTLKDMEKTTEELNEVSKGFDTTIVEHRVKILKELGYLMDGEDGLIEISEKGETAREILLGDEVLLLELCEKMEKFKEVFGKALFEVFGGVVQGKEDGLDRIEVDEEQAEKLVECVKKLQEKTSILKEVFAPEDPLEMAKNFLLWDIRYLRYKNFGESVNHQGVRHFLVARINAFLRSIEDELEFDALSDRPEFPVYLM